MEFHRWTRGWAAWTVATAGVVAVQASAGRDLRSLGVEPDLPLLAIVYLGLHGRKHAVLPAAVWVASLAAMFTLEPPVHVLALYVGIAGLVVAVRGLLFREHPLTEGLVVVLVTVLFRAAPPLLFVPPGGAGSEGWIAACVVSASINGVIALLAFPFLRRIGVFRRLLVARAI